jgi:hypothetical protein
MWVFAFPASAAPSASCDLAALERGREAAEHVAIEHLVALSAAALSEACTWPPPVAEALSRLGNGWPGSSDLGLAAAAPLALEAACPGGVRAMAQAAALAPAEARAHVHATCRPGFATAAEWGTAPGLLVAPVLFAGWLVKLGAPPETARVYARSLAGLSDRAEDHPIRVFAPLFDLSEPPSGE